MTQEWSKSTSHVRIWQKGTKAKTSRWEQAWCVHTSVSTAESGVVSDDIEEEGREQIL